MADVQELETQEEDTATEQEAKPKKSAPKPKRKKKLQGVWGIDLGQCALKALRCVLDGDTVVAEAFDLIEYPKILSQPEANPEELIAEALTTFLSRNDIRHDKVIISLAGQSGLCKFFKPPPVDAKRLPDIVKYEARQIIPFPLDEVNWDFQKMPGGQEVDGFTLEAEVGIFAMKRDQVYRALQPFKDAGIDLDVVQLAPLSIYNFIAYDVMTDGPDPDLFDPDNPPESLAVLSMGTDTTDLVVTNGFRVWQRSIPIGGSHFTKQLTKDLKLTFAKAEHLKRNARQAEDPKMVFQAMRPVFNDLVTEVQRSLGFFQQIDRKAKIKGILMLGNTVKLPGLQQYVAKNLGHEVVEFGSFSRLSGSSVISSPMFKENVLAFGVCYGLCLQGLGQTYLRTNLIPREILTERLIRAKKPWALAGIALIMLACSFNYFFHFRHWYRTHDDHWKTAVQSVDSADRESNANKSKDQEKKELLKRFNTIATEVVGNADRRLLWLELLKAINSSLPVTGGRQPGHITPIKDLAIAKRQELYVSHIESQFFKELDDWFTDRLKAKYVEGQRIRDGKNAPNTPAPTEPAPPANPSDPNAPPVDDVKPPAGPGWVIEIHGHHFFNENTRTQGAVHVRNTLMKNLEEGSILLPGDKEAFTMQELGIGYVVLMDDTAVQKEQVPNPDYTPPNPNATTTPDPTLPTAPTVPLDDTAKPTLILAKYTFTVQFCWQEKLLSTRLEARRKKKLEEKGAETPPNSVAANVPAANPGAANANGGAR